MTSWTELEKDLQSVGIDVGSHVPIQKLIEMGWNKTDSVINDHIQNVFEHSSQEPLFDPRTP